MADVVAVEQRGMDAARHQLALDQIGDRRFAGAGEAGEPQDRRPLVLDRRVRLARDGEALAVDVGGAAQAVGDHPRRRRFVGGAVDQDEGPGLAVLRVRVVGDRRGGGEIGEADLVERQRLGGELVEIVDVDAMLELGHRGRDGARADLHQVGAAGQQRLVAHPDQMGGELVGDLRPRGGRRQHVAAGDVDLVGERQRHRVARFGLFGRRRRRAGCRSPRCGGPTKRRRSHRRA